MIWQGPKDYRFFCKLCPLPSPPKKKFNISQLNFPGGLVTSGVFSSPFVATKPTNQPTVFSRWWSYQFGWVHQIGAVAKVKVPKFQFGKSTNGTWLRFRWMLLVNGEASHWKKQWFLFFLLKWSSRLAMDLLDDVLNWFRKILLKRNELTVGGISSVWNIDAVNFFQTARSWWSHMNQFDTDGCCRAFFFLRLKKNRGKTILYHSKTHWNQQVFFPWRLVLFKIPPFENGTNLQFRKSKKKPARFWMSQLELRGQIMSCFGWEWCGNDVGWCLKRCQR